MGVRGCVRGCVGVCVRVGVRVCPCVCVCVGEGRNCFVLEDQNVNKLYVLCINIFVLPSRNKDFDYLIIMI